MLTSNAVVYLYLFFSSLYYTISALHNFPPSAICSVTNYCRTTLILAGDLLVPIHELHGNRVTIARHDITDHKRINYMAFSTDYNCNRAKLNNEYNLLKYILILIQHGKNE